MCWYRSKIYVTVRCTDGVYVCMVDSNKRGASYLVLLHFLYFVYPKEF